MLKENIIENIQNINETEIKKYLLFDGENQQKLFDIACEIRNQGKFQNNVELRSVIELSNICSQSCKYCSMGKNGKSLYTLTNDEITKRIEYLAQKGRRTILLQSGEIHNQKFFDNVAQCLKHAVKIYNDMKFILCFGNLSDEQYIQLKEAGAFGYILKFETSNPEHHKFCRPSDSIENRLGHINKLIEIGYKTGSGNIIGLPNQTLDNLIEDLKLIKNLDLSMVSATKFIPNEFSEFKDYPAGNLDTTLNFIAILRILKPDCLIPSTTSLEKGSKNGQLKGLLAGCNTITVHDGTPDKFKKNYSIYSEKRFTPTADYCAKIIKQANMTPKCRL